MSNSSTAMEAWAPGHRDRSISISVESRLTYQTQRLAQAHAENYHLSKSQHETVLNLATLQLDAKAAASLSLSPHAVLRQPPCAFAGPK